MKFTERREYLYDPAVFNNKDAQTAMNWHHNAIVKLSGRPYPRFFEVERKSNVDTLWHQSATDRPTFSRTIDVPCIVQFSKLNWALARLGRFPTQQVKFWTSNKALSELDYFPLNGDIIFFNGYRMEIYGVEFEPNAFWHQTNAWLGLILLANIVPDGDLRPLADPSAVAKTEISTAVSNVNAVLLDKSKLPGSCLPPNKLNTDESNMVG